MRFLNEIDDGALFWFQGQHRPWLDAIMVGLTWLGHPLVLLGVVLAGALALFLLRGRTLSALLLAGSLALAYLLALGVQVLIGRDRPLVSTALVPLPATKSFPSLYALNGMAVYLFLGLALARDAVRGRALIVGLFFLVAFLVGLSRMYVGTSYVSDVIGGWLGGAGIALVLAGVDRSLGTPREAIDRTGAQAAEPAPQA